MLAMAPPAAMLTEGLSLPLMVVRGVKEAYGANVPRTLHVHVLGAEAPELLGLRKFREIFAWLPETDELRVTCVGLNLKQDSALELQPAEDARAFTEQKPFYYAAVAGAYHDVKASLGAAPTICVAQHSGLHDATHTANWTPTLRALLDAEIPTVFSGYTRQEILKDADVLRSLGARLTAEPFRNPLRGLRPYAEVPGVSSENPEPFYYANNYVLAFRGKAEAPH